MSGGKAEKPDVPPTSTTAPVPAPTTAPATTTTTTTTTEPATEPAKAGGKKKIIEKSMIIMDVKPMDSDTNLDDLEKAIKAITMDGLNWGEFRREPLVYGLFKLRIAAVLIDSLVGTDDLTERVENIPGELVQSVDLISHNKC